MLVTPACRRYYRIPQVPARVIRPRATMVTVTEVVDAVVGSGELGLEEPSYYVEAEQVHRQAVSDSRASGNSAAEGRAMLAVAWALEKQGRGAAALACAETTGQLLQESDDLRLVAEYHHSCGVWKFHHTDGAPPVDDFLRAIDARTRSGDLMGAAQSWHNLGYVQLIDGRADDAATSYDRATDLLGRVRNESDPAKAAFAFRQQGFVLSHQAFAAAHHQPLRDALRAALAYFRHVEETGAHREPVLAYLAPGVALARSQPEISAEELRSLESLVGLPPDAETWLRAAVREAALAMVEPTETGTGRRAYLGSHLLALAELGEWCAAHDRLEEARQHWARAGQLARARGWLGEVSRLARRDARARKLPS